MMRNMELFPFFALNLILAEGLFHQKNLMENDLLCGN